MVEHQILNVKELLTPDRAHIRFRIPPSGGAPFALHTNAAIFEPFSHRPQKQRKWFSGSLFVQPVERNNYAALFLISSSTVIIIIHLFFAQQRDL